MAHIHFWRGAFLALLTIWPAHELLAAEASGIESSRIMVRGGAVWLEANSVGSFTFVGAPLPGAELSVENESHHGLLFTWMLNEQFALETVVSTPFNLGINVGGGALGNEFRAGEIDVLPTMLIGRYNLPWVWHGFRPFVGVGAAYLWFRSPKTTDTFDAVGVSFGVQDARIEVKNQWRPVVELGIDYLLGEHWFTNVTWLYIEGDVKVATVFLAVQN